MTQPARADARLELVDMDVLDLDAFPPIDEWSEDDWDEAILITRSARIEATETEWTPWEQVKSDLGVDDRT